MAGQLSPNNSPVDTPPLFLYTTFNYSSYDAYLGRLLRVAFFVKPELLNSSQRQISFTDLVEFSSIAEAREHMIEKEVESVIRDSHAAHFDWMENRFAINLRRGLTIWSKFIEICERRNLFVHCDGVISSQYINVCKKNGVILDKQIKVGNEQTVFKKYFEEAIECILEIGIKLGYVLWRKLQPEKISEADDSLHQSTYALLVEERYNLTIELLNFAINTLKKQPTEIVNVVIS